MLADADDSNDAGISETKVFIVVCCLLTRPQSLGCVSSVQDSERRRTLSHKLRTLNATPDVLFLPQLRLGRKGSMQSVSKVDISQWIVLAEVEQFWR